jgi:hypothetical protein
MIIFTEEFPFDNRIKKEALGIWYIFNIINTDELLSHFNYFEYNLQKYLEYSNLPVNENMTDKKYRINQRFYFLLKRFIK